MPQSRNRLTHNTRIKKRDIMTIYEVLIFIRRKHPDFFLEQVQGMHQEQPWLPQTRKTSMEMLQEMIMRFKADEMHTNPLDLIDYDWLATDRWLV